MSSQQSSTSRAQLRKKLISKGYTPLPATGKGVFIPKWSTLEVTEAWLDGYARHGKYSNTGLRCDDLVAFDIDATDEDLADEIEEIIEQSVGRTEACRFGAYPKRLLLYRLEGEPGRSATTGKYGDHRIDLLCGSGRQFIAYGKHPAGHEYEWDDAEPLTMDLAELPACSHTEALEALEACEAHLEATGLERVSNAYTRDMDDSFTLTADTRVLLDDGSELLWGDLRGQLTAEGVFGNVVRENGEFGDSDGVHFMLARGSGQPCAHDFVRGCTYWEAPVDAQALSALPDAQQTMFDDPILTDMLKNYVSLDDGTVRSIDEPYDPIELGKFKANRKHLRIRTRDGRRVSAAEEWQKHADTMRARRVEMHPESTEILVKNKNGVVVMNSYVQLQHLTEGGEIFTFTEFMEHLIPDERERDIFLDWLAVKIAHPELRLHAMLMVTKTMGTGRGTLERIIGALLGKQYIKQVPLEQFIGRGSQGAYNAYMADSLLVSIPEALEQRDEAMQYEARRQAFERIKLLCDTGETEMAINRKFGRNTHERVYASVLIATNHAQAIAIPENDRRIIVLQNTTIPLNRVRNRLKERIASWLDRAKNIGLLYRTLIERAKRTEYDPYGMPPYTTARAQMIDAGKSEFDHAFHWVLDNAPGDVMTPKQLQNWMLKGFKETGLELPDYHVIRKAMFSITTQNCSRCLGLNKSHVIKFRGSTERPWVIRNKFQWQEETDNRAVREELDKNAVAMEKKTNILPFEATKDDGSDDD